MRYSIDKYFSQGQSIICSGILEWSFFTPEERSWIRFNPAGLGYTPLVEVNQALIAWSKAACPNSLKVSRAACLRSKYPGHFLRYSSVFKEGHQYTWCYGTLRACRFCHLKSDQSFLIFARFYRIWKIIWCLLEDIKVGFSWRLCLLPD